MSCRGFAAVAAGGPSPLLGETFKVEPSRAASQTVGATSAWSAPTLVVIPSAGAVRRRSRGIAIVPAEAPSTGTTSIPRLRAFGASLGTTCYPDLERALLSAQVHVSLPFGLPDLEALVPRLRRKRQIEPPPVAEALRLKPQLRGALVDELVQHGLLRRRPGVRRQVRRGPYLVDQHHRASGIVESDLRLGLDQPGLLPREHGDGRVSRRILELLGELSRRIRPLRCVALVAEQRARVGLVASVVAIVTRVHASLTADEGRRVRRDGVVLASVGAVERAKNEPLRDELCVGPRAGKVTEHQLRARTSGERRVPQLGAVGSRGHREGVIEHRFRALVPFRRCNRRSSMERQLTEVVREHEVGEAAPDQYGRQLEALFGVCKDLSETNCGGVSDPDRAGCVLVDLVARRARARADAVLHFAPRRERAGVDELLTE